MVEKITSLTPEQTARFPEFVDKWTQIGTSTEPVDFENAKKAVCLAYRLAGLEEPTRFYVADGPLAAIKLIKELDPNQKDSEIVSNMTYGSQEAAWLSFYDYNLQVFGLNCCEKLQGIMDLSMYSGWVSMYDDTVVFQHRPDFIKFDDQKRLHCENGPAIRYRDGLCVYAWHGIRIPDNWLNEIDEEATKAEMDEWMAQFNSLKGSGQLTEMLEKMHLNIMPPPVIKKKSVLTPKIALTWTNIEQRRCACEIIGWDCILDELKAKTIDEDDDPMIGKLVQVNIPDIGKEKFLRVVCGTGRKFAIPVPPNMKTALEANAWSYDIPADMLKQLEIRT